MVRVKHFESVPDANTRKQVHKLHRQQMLQEGKASPPLSQTTGSTASLAPTPSPPRLALARSRTSAIRSRQAKALQLIEQHLFKEVAWFSGTLAGGHLIFALPVGLLHVAIDEDEPFLEHHLHPEDGDGIVRCNFISLNDENPIMTAVNILQIVEAYVTSPLTSSKVKLTQCLKKSIIKPTRATELHNMLRKNPREICDDANVARYGWHFLRAEQIIEPAMEKRFANRIEEMRAELNKLSISDISNSVPEPARSKSKSLMIDYLLKPQYTFHGPKAANINNIAAFGLLAAGDINPATGERIPGRLGSTYGPGVYVTEEAHLALTYCDWNRLSLLSIDLVDRPPGVLRKRMIICAAVLGRAALVTPSDGFREKLHLYPGAHSHVANSGQEFVLPPSQVLPICVADFDWIPNCPQHRANYMAYANQMVNPPKDSVEKQGRWWKFGGASKK